MIELPDLARSFDYENGFYLSCDVTRISKILAHYELFKMVLDVPGAIVECGVFKGASLARFAMLRDIFGSSYSKKLVGFDRFGSFPVASFGADRLARQKFVDLAGQRSISVEQMREVLKHKQCDRFVDLVTW